PGARVYGDARDVALDDGKFGIACKAGVVSAADLAGEIGEVINGDKPGRTSPEEVTIFDSAGLAVQDMVCALHVYQQATQHQIGTFIDLGLADLP
ncbi:MAG: ornithine cyclodeaminase family protein, partial [Chloroflexaceae bacterium]|nr:ornithine cyclodeaminase family protein [Chloroflexaceae bacterium]